MQLDKKALGLALGIPCGIAMLLATLWAWFNHGGEHLGLLSRFYPWYGITPFGLAQRLGGEFTQSQAAEIIDDYKTRYAGIDRFLQQCVAHATLKCAKVHLVHMGILRDHNFQYVGIFKHLRRNRGQ